MSVDVEDHLFDRTPRVAGYGPLACSTCTDLDIHPRIIWDTNRYYASLGVSPYASRQEIRNAYDSRQGWLSEKLTYHVKQLLHPVVKRMYDLTPLGYLFPDRYIHDLIQRMRRLQNIESAQESDDMWDFDMEDPEDDIDLVDHKTIPQDPQSTQGLAKSGGWHYSYFQKGTYVFDDTRMRQWQEALVIALSERRVVMRIAVGLEGDTASPWAARIVGPHTVIFLRDDLAPTSLLARQVADLTVEITKGMR